MQPLYWIINTVIVLSVLLLTNSGRVKSQPRSIILLAGQSNMSGRGGVINEKWDGIIPPENGATRSVYRFTATHEWVEAFDPLHKDIDRNHTCGVGPGMSMAHEVVRKAQGVVGPVGLVPCAVGGTNMSEWRRGSKLYEMLMRRARSSVKKGGGAIEGLVWYQGESDTVVKEDADAYKSRVLKFFGDLRTDLNSPMLPIIQVAITSGEGHFIEEVRQAQMEVDMMNLETVDAKGLPLEPDNLHLTTPAQVQLGQKLGRAFLKFLPKKIHTNTGSFLVQNDAPNNNNNHIFHKNSFYTALFFLFSYFVIISLLQRL